MSLDLRGTLQVVKRAASKHIRLVEDSEASYIDDEGYSVKGPTRRETVMLSWQPISGKKLESLELGALTKEARSFWSLTKTELGDNIVVGDEIFKVMNNQYWEALNINGKSIGFWEGVMVRTGDNMNVDEDAYPS